MLSFIGELGDRVLGVLSGFDRLLFRGILRCVIDARGLNGYLYGAKVSMTDYRKHVRQVSTQITEASLKQARQTGREIRYLYNSQDKKKDLALEIATRDRIHDGLICVFGCVEPCMSFDVRRDRQTKKIWLERRPRKCLHLYHYFHHSRWGLMHARLQTWFPFTMQICLNGREWLARDLMKAGIGHLRQDNCVYHVEDFEAAQRFLDQQLTVSWPALLGELVRQVHPAHESIFANCPHEIRNYYWSAAETEWATDVLFRHRADVLPIAKRLAAASLRLHGPAEVMRFLGRTARADGLPRSSFSGEIQSDARLFEEGLRIKHRINANSVKMYNRPCALRFETTINNTKEFKVWRTPENAPEDVKPQWLKLRSGVADLHRRAQVSQASNDRFAAAQAAVLSEDALPLKDLVTSLCSRVTRPGREKADGTRTRSRTFRALNPLASHDIRLLTVISHPKFGIAGLHNADVRAELYGDDPANRQELRRRSSAVSRQLALLRAHGLLEKVPKSQRYRVTTRGRQSLTALLAAANATVAQLNNLAA